MYIFLIDSNTTGGSSQQDKGDVGSSFIQHLPEGVSQQCKMHSASKMVSFGLL